MRSLAVKLRSSFSKPPATLTKQYASSCVTSIGRRYIQIQTTPSPALSSSALNGQDAIINDLSPPFSSESPDARFEILGSTPSLLSVSLSASQNLYTRRGTLAGVAGAPENAISTLSPLSPLQRIFVGIPFLYQRIISTTPLNLLISTKAPHTSFSVLHLDGRIDWIVAQRNGLVAWTGDSLAVRPRIQPRLSTAYWGSTLLTGRGLVALAGPGQIYQLTLKANERYVAHPSHVLAYTVTSALPTPYRFRSRTLRLQVPSLPAWLRPGIPAGLSNFLTALRNSTMWRCVAQGAFVLRRWARRTIWGDRLFLGFEGPCEILLQSRGGRIRDVLTREEVDEVADTPAGLVSGGRSAGSTSSGVGVNLAGGVGPGGSGGAQTPRKMGYAQVGKDGKVTFS